MDNLYTARLKTFRKSRENRSTQLEFSEDLDITPEYYSIIETGSKNPSMSLHIDICLSLNKPSDCFFNEKHKDISLTKQQQEYLMALDEKELRSLLETLQTLYEEENK